VRRAHLPRGTSAGCSGLLGTNVDDLVRYGRLGSAGDDSIHVERVPNTYPIYKLNYLSELTGT
jgi:hypothetical protein